MLDGQLKELSENADREKLAREATAKTVKDKAKATEAVEKRVVAAEKAKALTEKRFMELEAKQNEADLKLAKAISLNAAQAKELADLRAALEACENKWDNEGFADTKNFVELVIREARRLAFEKGWLAVLQALGVPANSPLRDPGKIPFLDPTPTVHNSLVPINEEELPSLRELVEQLDSHVELDDMKVTSNSCAND